jgi:hypothetical protein
MDSSSFWLISIEETNVLVSLISQKTNSYSVASIGSKINWSSESEDSIVSAVDESISQACENISLPEDAEPESAAFILPPFWVGSDGKITSPKLKLIESICKNLKLKPMGFIANDEAITEEANSIDGFPASFILINLGQNFFTLSLVYLGKIKERLHKTFFDKFNANLIESALLEINSESALPPQIIIFGDAEESLVSEIQNFPWVGKKNVEVFLHFPDVKFYNTNDITNIYAKVIVSQMGGFLPSPSSKKDEENIEEEGIIENPIEEKSEFLEEVDPSDLGFGSELINQSFEQEPIEENIVPSQDLIKETIPKKNNFNSKFKLPKISFPKFKFKKLSLWPLALAPLLLLIPLFFSKADITLFVTPYNFQKSVPITLDSTNSSKKTFDISSSASIKTTGQKTVGDKAQGEIIVYNKLDKSQNISKGSILTDPSGKKFELLNAVSIASSSSDLNVGIINLGQTKTLVSASDIGSEYNLSKDTKLTFKDFSENSLIAKVNNSLSGGSKRQINAVSQQDKTNLEQKLNQVIKESSDKKINEDLSSINGIIRETIQNQKDRIEFSREVGEEADNLDASVTAKVSVFYLSADQKSQIINNFLANENGFDKSNINPDSFKFEFKVEQLDSDKAVGTLTIKGQSLPKIDIQSIKQKISGKSKNKTIEIIKKDITRVYNFKIKTNFQFLDFINPMPFLKENININVKTESL